MKNNAGILFRILFFLLEEILTEMIAVVLWVLEKL